MGAYFKSGLVRDGVAQVLEEPLHAEESADEDGGDDA